MTISLCDDISGLVKDELAGMPPECLLQVRLHKIYKESADYKVILYVVISSGGARVVC